MEEEKANYYEVKFTKLAKQHLDELLTYFYDLYTVERAEDIANSLVEKAFSLSHLPFRGRIEESLKEESFQYRFILFQRTKRAIDIVFEIYHLFRKD